MKHLNRNWMLTLHKKRIYFLNFLKTYLKLTYLGYSFMESLETMTLSKNQCPWIAEFIFALHQGQSVEFALQPLRHYFHELDFHYFRLSLKNNQLSEFANNYIQDFEQKNKIKARIKEQAFYPLFLMSLSIVLFILLQFFLLPEYHVLTKSLGLHETTSLQLGPLFPISMTILSFFALINHYFPQIKNKIFPVSLELEIITWAETVAIGLKANLPLIECLIIIDTHLKLHHLKSFTQDCIFHLRTGHPIFFAFNHAPTILREELHTHHFDIDFFDQLKLKFQYKILSRLSRIEHFIQPFLLFLVGIICLYFFYKLYQPLMDISL